MWKILDSTQTNNLRDLQTKNMNSISTQADEISGKVIVKILCKNSHTFWRLYTLNIRQNSTNSSLRYKDIKNSSLEFRWLHRIFLFFNHTNNSLLDTTVMAPTLLTRCISNILNRSLFLCMSDRQSTCNLRKKWTKL